MKTKILKYGKKVAGEKRQADFLRAFGRSVETTRIVSFGACNFACPYCKRDCQLLDSNGLPIRAHDVTLDEIKGAVKPHIKAGERLRLSGGDPVMFPKESVELGKWAKEEFGEKISIAHNGSSLRYAKMMSQYLEYAAIDLKGYNGRELAFRAGIPEKAGDNMLKSTLAVQDYLAAEGVLVDVRSPIFKETTLDHLYTMASMICRGGTENKFWTLRAYNPVKWVDWEGVNQDTLLQYAEVISAEFPDLPIGLRLKWSGQKEFAIFKGGKKI